MKKLFKCLLLLPLVTLAMQPARASYPDRTIQLVVGSQLGGGYATWAQAIAPFIAKHLPNHQNVVVRYMPGWPRAAAYLQRAVPDGYTIGLYNMAGLAAAEVAGKAAYDLRQVTWLGRLASDPSVLVVDGTGNYRNIKDFQRQIKPSFGIATKGPKDRAALIAAVTFHELHVKWNPQSYQNTTQAVLSVVGDETDAMFGSYPSLRRYIVGGYLLPVLYYDGQRNPSMPNVPIPSDIGIGELNEAFNDQRLIGAPPGLPAAIRKTLERAIARAIADPAFRAVLKRHRKAPDYLDGPATARLVQTSLASYQEYAPIIRSFLANAKKAGKKKKRPS